MQTQAYFEEIQKHILHEIEKAISSIQIAVAWFTDMKLFSALCNKAKSGVPVELMLMNDEINNTCGINYDLLTNSGGKVWKITNSGGHDSLMHNKFCVLDNNTVINGSYNWTRKARQNHESITIISDNNELALQFSDEFRSIKEKYFGKNAESLVVNYSIICSRLKSLHDSIRTGDKEDIEYLSGKLKKHIKSFNDANLSNIYQIIEHLEKYRFAEAVNEISSFIDRYTTLVVYIDPEIAALRLELRVLELQISSLDDEKVELEKLLHEFEVRHNQELGDILIKILRLRLEKLKFESEQNTNKEKEYIDAEEDFTNYNNSYNTLKQEKIIELNEEQKNELKNMYRKASKLCHPDVVGDKFKKDAEEIFKELNKAYNKNDLEKVKQILNNLEKGIFKQGSETISEKQELLWKVANLRNLRDALENEVQKIKSHPTHLQLIKIEDWDEYFAGIKKELVTELNHLESATPDG